MILSQHIAGLIAQTTTSLLFIQNNSISQYISALPWALTQWLALSTLALSQGPPRLDLLITPTLPSSISNGSLAVKLSIQSPGVVENGTLLNMFTVYGNVPCNDYNQNALSVLDDLGVVPIELQDSNSLRLLVAKRATSGDVSVSFTAYPRQVDATTPVGPRVDLRENFGGLIGSGICFLPLPPTNITYDVHLRWNLTEDPQAIWTFGEGVEVNITAPASFLADSLYAVGPIKTLTDPAAEGFGMYWFGGPTFNVTLVASTTAYLFSRMAPFFGDSPSMIYRVFLRHSPRGYGGTAFQNSFILEYDDEQIKRTSELSVINLLAHEMVHNWPRLQPEVDEATAWYTEGIAQYYALALPYRFGIYNQSDFLSVANGLATGYYTSPVRNLSNTQAAELSWTNSHAQRLPYYRGFMYLVQVGHQISKASNGTRSLDDLVLTLLQAKRARQDYGVDLWVQLLRNELGDQGVAEFNGMLNGTLIIPLSGSILRLIRDDEEPYDLGFAEESINNRVVSGLDPGSRAAKAGVRDGDEILNNFSIWESTDDMMTKIDMTVVRDGQDLQIQSWPRSWEKVEAYRWQLA